MRFKRKELFGVIAAANKFQPGTVSENGDKNTEIQTGYYGRVDRRIKIVSWQLEVEVQVQVVRTSLSIVG
jgi:hypothetical protein